ncbi:MAG TPA: hypothetical protein ENI57_06435 [Ignavibacteria bacterium]|nr:hypothetical protein [Ignavibacteria bacterium]
MNMKMKLFLVIVLSLFLVPSLTHSQTILFSEVESSLMCTCGCNMVLTSCQCTTADKMRSKIKSMLAQGKSKDQILASYVNLFGETVLSEPTKEGFNLTAWITPFIAIGAVGFLLYKAVNKWSGQRTQNKKIPDDLLLEYGTKLKNELDNFEDGDKT